MLDMLSYSGATRSVVLNRCDSRVGLSVNDIERTIKTAVAGELPSSRDVSASINRGVPLAAEQPDHNYSKALLRFVEHHITSAPFSTDTTGSSRPW
jgi:MinD-like ATPase involved in chromosome partitioning or flagellar assembly